MFHLDEYDILHHLQQGFHQDCSCETQYYWHLLSDLASGNQTDLITMDFSNAIAEVCQKKYCYLNLTTTELEATYFYGLIASSAINSNTL